MSHENSYFFTCKDCVFVTKNEHDTQNGCKLDRINKFKEQGFDPKIVNNYYKIDGLLGCSTKRNEQWEFSDATFEEQKNVIMKAHEVQYDIIFYWSVEYTKMADRYLLSDLNEMLSRLDNLQIRPHKIIVALEKTAQVDIKEIAKILSDSGYQYGISTLEPGLDDGELINLAYQLTESPYMWIVDLQAYFEPIPDKVNNLIQSFNRPLLVFDDLEKEEVFTNCVLFHQLKGCDSLDEKEPGSLECYIEKVKLLAEDQNKTDLLYTTQELFNA